MTSIGRLSVKGLTAMLLAWVLLLASVLAGAGAALANISQGGLRVDVLSNRADLISGGDALVQVQVPLLVDPNQVRVDVDGRDVTSSFAVRADGSFTGLVTGLRDGDNVLTARAPFVPGSRITITNHPIGGPIFSGAQVQPWICKNVALGLATPVDAQCDGPARFTFVYKSTATNGFAPYDPANPPAAGLVASTTTDQGVTVPYIVRVERGSEDRGIYDIAVLSDPAAPWVPWASQPGWNHKVVWTFGASAAVHHSNGAPQPVLVDLPLSRGFMVANNSLNTHGQNANMVVSAEAMTMLKEHIAETYGSIRYTIGSGCSGGSIEQYVMAADYPGLVDGLMPNCSYQDSWTTGNEVGDCHLLVHFFNVIAPGAFTSQQQTAVMGTQDTTPCLAWDGSFAQSANPSLAVNCDLQAFPNLVYNAATNPTGVRCTPQDYEVAIWGTRPQDGFARRPSDNVGIQYGLDALNHGDITPDQFIALNQGIGGNDIDLNFTAARTQADLAALPIAYRAGQVTSGREWANVPIIDLRGSHNFNDIHTDFHSYVARARLDDANGTHANQLIWTWAVGGSQSIVTPPAVAQESFLLMDRWLTAIEADDRGMPLRLKVLKDRPSDAVDACFINNVKVTDEATCTGTFPHYADARIAAGGPLTDDVMKCQLQPLNPRLYDVEFTPAQWSQLQQVFPGGVCDFRRDSVGRVPSVSWLTFTNGPGGEPLGDAPRSHTTL